MRRTSGEVAARIVVRKLGRRPRPQRGDRFEVNQRYQEVIGERGGNRTHDPLIKSHWKTVFYQVVRQPQPLKLLIFLFSSVRGYSGVSRALCTQIAPKFGPCQRVSIWVQWCMR